VVLTIFESPDRNRPLVVMHAGFYAMAARQTLDYAINARKITVLRVGFLTARSTAAVTVPRLEHAIALFNIGMSIVYTVARLRD
jgi:hypothetical protein